MNRLGNLCNDESISEISNHLLVTIIKNLVLSICLTISASVYAQDSAESFWIDVRTIKEYQQGHLDGSVNIPHTEIQRRISEITDDKQATIHLYCVAGIRAQIAKSALENLGYQNVINEGGLKDIQARE